LAMSDQMSFVPNDLCWVRTGKAGRFYPARIVGDEDLNERQMWRGSPPLYSVIFFDKDDVHAGSAYHVRALSKIKSWKMGMEEGLDKKLSTTAINRALRYSKMIQENICCQEANLPLQMGNSNRKRTDSDASSYEFELPFGRVHSSNAEEGEKAFKQTESNASSSVGSKKRPQRNYLMSVSETHKDDDLDPSSSIASKKRRASSVTEDAQQQTKPGDRTLEKYPLAKLSLLALVSITDLIVVYNRIAANRSVFEQERPMKTISKVPKPWAKAKSLSPAIEQKNPASMKIIVGFIGANAVTGEMVRAMFRRAHVRISAIWDQNADECEVLVKQLSDEGYDGIVRISSMEDLCSKSDVIFCCLEQRTLMHEEKDEKGGVELLLDKVLAAAGKAHIGVFLITFFSRVLARAASLMLNDYAQHVPVVGVSICGAIGRANVAFVSGNMHLYETYDSVIRSLATNIIYKGDEPAKAILCGAAYNRFMMGLTFETYAWRAFAAEYGMHNSEMNELLNESNLLNDFVNLAVPAILDDYVPESMQRIVASTTQAWWVISAAMGTYAAASNSRAMVQTGLKIHQSWNRMAQISFSCMHVCGGDL
uniref:NAD(P)-bd_dom domain-containing protein n=1 Tax=Toxocara canis TaxID=6265 RepID=A0A183V2E1_TOXCA